MYGGNTYCKDSKIGLKLKIWMWLHGFGWKFDSQASNTLYHRIQKIFIFQKENKLLKMEAVNHCK